MTGVHSNPANPVAPVEPRLHAYNACNSIRLDIPLGEDTFEGALGCDVCHTDAVFVAQHVVEQEPLRIVTVARCQDHSTMKLGA